MWKLKTFDELSTHELFAIYKVRTDIFVVEQNCAYPEVDDKDLTALHLFLENGQAVSAYCRIIPNNELVQIGRVLVSPENRKKGLAKELVTKALSICQKTFPNQPIYIQAQAYLKSFYASFGFQPSSQEYLEDGIPHIDMKLKK
ncbi:GNAT family N-acetyltransferase [Streptococcus ratti]|uniref:Acetyltransferase n=1 Tax=Streptococcus ratti FA-1 = DSM 20564 TaxID=699248 RepID=A0ABP2QXH4_STRRT|nr:GNAT family N-acetyltransferase [Streptococcus ratti]EJN93567.1 acetyltransferase [Streptococcus ratti FA-1 = DSM 20564]EMP69141.1 acetyltransferase (GNAT) family protein [Streptococcus ratti FA-1 = DSM 20564]QEY07437.1 GNAT family N-acetyltransferase [Streptococcus ratti]VEI59887.1 acetyltransferase [Streptococcus mutans]